MEAKKSTVELPRWALVTLVVALLSTLLTLAFLFGRMSAQGPLLIAATPLADKGPAQPLVTEQAPTQIPVTVATPTPVIAPPQAPPPTATVETPPATPPEKPLPRLSEPDKHAVHLYLQHVDALTSNTAQIGDPTEFATNLLGQAAAGDTSAFDGLIESVHQAQGQLALIRVPAPCKEHFHLVKEQLNGSLSLLTQLKKATIDMDTSGLPGLALQGQRMQGQAHKLESLTHRLRKQSRTNL